MSEFIYFKTLWRRAIMRWGILEITGTWAYANVLLHIINKIVNVIRIHIMAFILFYLYVIFMYVGYAKQNDTKRPTAPIAT